MQPLFPVIPVSVIPPKINMLQRWGQRGRGWGLEAGAEGQREVLTPAALRDKRRSSWGAGEVVSPPLSHLTRFPH